MGHVRIIGTVTVTVLVHGQRNNDVSIAGVTAAPGLVERPSSGELIVQHADDDSINRPSNPAPGGSTIIAYLINTGAGIAGGEGRRLRRVERCADQRDFVLVTATIGPATATVSFHGLTPGFIGLAQMNIVVPALAPGVYPLVVTIDGQNSNSATIAVK